LYADDPRWCKYVEEILSNPELFPADLFDHSQVLAAWRDLKEGKRERALDIEKLLQLGLFNLIKKAGFSRFSVESVAA